MLTFLCSNSLYAQDAQISHVDHQPFQPLNTLAGCRSCHIVCNMHYTYLHVCIHIYVYVDTPKAYSLGSLDSDCDSDIPVLSEPVPWWAQGTSDSQCHPHSNCIQWWHNIQVSHSWSLHANAGHARYMQRLTYASTRGREFFLHTCRGRTGRIYRWRMCIQDCRRSSYCLSFLWDPLSC